MLYELYSAPKQVYICSQVLHTLRCAIWLCVHSYMGMIILATCITELLSYSMKFRQNYRFSKCL